jgi:hypothetical protein
MVLSGFDPSQIPSSLQSDTEETKKGSKVPTCYNVSSKTTTTFNHNRRNSHTQSIKKASPVKRSVSKENISDSEVAGGIALYSKARAVEQSPAKLQPYASPSKTMQQEEYSL